MRANIQDPSGRVLGKRFGLVFTPTFVLVDEHGREVRRDLGALDARAILSWLERRA